MNEQASNVLRVGISTLDEIEEKIKAFRIMNRDTRQKRYLISRENVYNSNHKLILKKTDDIDVVKAKLLRRSFRGSHVFKTFQPDEGIVVVSDASSPKSSNFSNDLIKQVRTVGQGLYDAFIDRVDNFHQLHQFFQKTLFPRLVIVGYLPPETLEQQKVICNNVILREDPHIRCLEVVHSDLKPIPILSEVKQVHISTQDAKSWQKLIQEIIREYKKPYLVKV